MCPCFILLTCIHATGNQRDTKSHPRSPTLRPYLIRAQVEAEVLQELRGPKIIVYKMKPKKHYRRKQGHRQNLTKFQVTSITV